MRALKITVNKTYLLKAILSIGIIFITILPVIIFVFFRPHYDRSDVFFYPFGNSPKTVLEEDITLIKQPFFSNSKNLARITIKSRFSKNKLRLLLSDDKGKIIRNTTNPHRTINQVVWNFTPIENSSKKKHTLTIEFLNMSNKNIKLLIVPAVRKNHFAEINGKTIDGKSLNFYTESKFTSSKEKMQTFYNRIKTYKPIFILWLFFPVLLFFFISLILFSLIIYNNFESDKTEP